MHGKKQGEGKELRKEGEEMRKISTEATLSRERNQIRQLWAQVVFMRKGPFMKSMGSLILVIANMLVVFIKIES